MECLPVLPQKKGVRRICAAPLLTIQLLKLYRNMDYSIVGK